MLLFKATMQCRHNLNIIEGREWMRSCMIIPIESTLMSQGNNDGEDMYNYSLQLFWSILTLYQEQKL